MQFTVVLNRSVDRRPNEETVKDGIQKLATAATRGSKGACWTYSIARSAEPVLNEFGLWVYTRKLTFTKQGNNKSATQRQWDAICRSLIQSAQSGPFKTRPWIITGENSAELYRQLTDEGRVAPIASDGEPVPDKSGVKTIKSIKNFGEINTDPGDHFDHIYGREHQIRIVQSALEAAKSSNFSNRFHCVLQGPPGCAKSDILKSVGKMLGKENEAFMMLDATSTTEAGAQKILLNSDYIPPVLIIEEIEKTDEKSLRWMLGILDHRAEIRKTNFNIGHNARNVKMLCLATVNNIQLFRKVMSGALYSRFAHSIYCPRPDRELMKRILEREVFKIKGNVEWIEPTLKFCMDEQGINDPRKIIPVCLCGMDNLLDGSYQKSLIAVQKPKKKAS